MGPDAEEGLAHDDKRQDVEDEIGGQIMEVQPIVEQEPADKVREKHYPLLRLRVGMICPSAGSRCAMSVDRYLAPRSFLMSSFVTEEAIHLPPAPDMFGLFLRIR